MQEAIPYSRGMRSTWPDIGTPDVGEGTIRERVAENPVLVVGRRGCCMCHVIRRLLLGLGVNPATCEVSDEIDDRALVKELGEIDRTEQTILVPAVFIGGRLVGGIDRLMALHISGDLVPILKEAGALWL